MHLEPRGVYFLINHMPMAVKKIANVLSKMVILSCLLSFCCSPLHSTNLLFIVLSGYDMKPQLKSAVSVYPENSINRPDILNTAWTTEIAFPLSKLMERNSHSMKPDDGVYWRMNFSRVQWGVKVDHNGHYEKAPCCTTCATPGTKAEDNWVWSKQGEVAMHLPERWGIVQFSSRSPREGEQMKYYAEWPARCAAMSL